MKFSDEFKLKCVEMYREGKYPETPEGISKKQFHKEVRQWGRVEEAAGPEALKHKNRRNVVPSVAVWCIYKWDYDKSFGCSLVPRLSP